MDVTELKQRSKDALTERHNGGYLCGGLLGLAVGFGLAGPFGLAGAALLAIKLNADWYKKYSDDWDRIGDDNCINHLDLLPESDVKALERQHGKELLKAAIKGDQAATAQILNVTVSQNFTVNQTNVNANINVQNHYHAAAAPVIEQPRQTVIDVDPQPIVEPAASLPIVEPTQLQAETVLQLEPEIKTQFLSGVEPEKKCSLYNPAEDLGRDPYSALILGVPGSGKGVFLGNAVRQLKKYHPDITVIGIDPKAKDEELGIWQGPFDKVYRRNILNDEPDYVATWLIQIIREVQKIDGPTLLIVDELTAISSKTKRVFDKELKAAVMVFEDYVCSLASLGNGYQKYVWGIAQAGQGQSLPFDTSVRNQLRVIALASDENLTAVQGLLRTDLIAGTAKEITMVQAALAQSPVSPNKVAFYDGKYPDRWLPMPVLEIYGQPRKADRMNAAKQEIAKAKDGFAQKHQPIAEMVDEAIAETIAAEAVDTEDLINRQAKANFDRIHSESRTNSPECPIELTTAILKCQELLGSKWNQEHLDMMLEPSDKDSYHRCLHKCMQDLDVSIGKFCSEICGKSDSGAFRQKASKYYQWLESQYGSIRKTVEI